MKQKFNDKKVSIWPVILVWIVNFLLIGLIIYAYK